MRIARKSRRTLLWGIGFFLLLQAGGGVALEKFYPLLRFPSARDALEVLEHQPTTHLVVLGSSRFGCGIDTPEAQRLVWSATGETRFRAFNLSVPGGEPISHEFLLDEMLARGVRPDWLLVELSPENLTCPGAWLPIHCTRQLGWRHFPTHIGEITRANSAPRYLGSLLLPLWVHRHRVLDALTRRPTSAPIERDVEVPPPIDWERVLRVPRLDSPEEQKRRLQEGRGAAHGWLRDYRVGGQSVRALTRFLRRCRQEQIGVVVVMPPLASPFRGEYTAEIEAAFGAHLSALRREYGFHCVDARDWVPDELFRDAGHLDNPAGTLHFTGLLARRVLLPLLADGRLVYEPGTK